MAKVLVIVDDSADFTTDKAAMMEQAASDPLFLADIRKVNEGFGSINREATIFYLRLTNMVTIIKKGTDRINIQKALESVRVRKGMKAFKYCGKVKVAMDPLTVQKNLRNEWE